jgi:hypothetical protein
METLQTFNAPFFVGYSSCSTTIPSKFRWTNDQSPNGAVFIDQNISNGIGYSGKKFAWIVESPEVIPQVINYVKVNRKLISYSYTALFTCLDSLIGLEPNFLYCPSGSNIPWIKNYKVYEKTKMCSMFASRKRYTSGHFYRETIAQKFKNRIDLFGGTLESARLGEGIHPDKAAGLNDYMFSIVIENCKQDKYYTEKITDCFATGTIPVYWGTDKIFEDFNSDGIIKLTDEFDVSMLSAELYNSKIQAVRDNFERVCNLKMADDYLFDKIKEMQ